MALLTVIQLLEALDGLPADMPIAVATPDHRGAYTIAGVVHVDGDVILQPGHVYGLPDDRDERYWAIVRASEGWPHKVIPAIGNLRGAGLGLTLHQAKAIVDELLIQEMVSWLQANGWATVGDLAQHFGVGRTSRHVQAAVDRAIAASGAETGRRLLAERDAATNTNPTS